MKPFTTKQIWLLTGIGFGCFLLYTVASATLSLMGHDMGIFITGSWKLPVVMVGFGMFLLFDRVTFHSRAVRPDRAIRVLRIPHHRLRRLRETAFGTDLFNLQNLYQQPWAILLILGILLAIFTQSALCLISSARHCSPSPSISGVDAGWRLAVGQGL